jgi:drug/metabolite transporter (DMT)-like permease
VPTERPGALSGVLTILLAASMFATLGVLSRTAYANGLGPFSFVTWRAGVGAVGLWTAVLVARRRGGGLPAWSAMSAGSRRGLVAASLLAAATNLSIFLAFQRTTIAFALLCFYTYPAIVAAASIALGRERLDLGRGFALVLATVGMAGVVLGGATGGTVQVDSLGLAAALAAAAGQAGFVLVAREYGEVPTGQAMATILLGTAIAAALVAAVAEGPGQLVAPAGSTLLLGLMGWVGVFAAAVPSWLLLVGIRRLGAVRTGIVMLAEPVVGVVLAGAFLAEAVTPLQAVGGVTILIAAFLVQRESAGEPVPAVSLVPGGP